MKESCPHVAEPSNLPLAEAASSLASKLGCSQQGLQPFTFLLTELYRVHSVLQAVALLLHWFGRLRGTSPITTAQWTAAERLAGRMRA